MTHAQTWKDLQGPRKTIPPLPLHRWSPGQYANAASHGDVALFRQRQAERAKRVQA